MFIDHLEMFLHSITLNRIKMLLTLVSGIKIEPNSVERKNENESEQPPSLPPRVSISGKRESPATPPESPGMFHMFFFIITHNHHLI